MAAKADITEELEFWALIQDVGLNKTVMAPRDIENVTGNSGVV